ncbi:uncharacterized protein LOC122091372 [Macadamia integrifolia]|uniref:uncharacterized protein LOC122091372 n=1 Tax=Macadamia integrifolia TaxID=60698 RepID=UPI001C4F2B9D|nr:uncharacterized protein LOC122091372 [Macadamia integrifolia]
MAATLFSLLLRRNSSPRNPNSILWTHSLIRKTRISSFNHGRNIEFFSTSQSSLLQTETELPKDPDPKTSLSARMSFVFDQIDAIEKERSGKDEALQRIRAWRETKKKKNEEEGDSQPGVSAGADSNLSSNLTSEPEVAVKKEGNLFKKEVEMVHPWPEWIELMERMVQQNYFDHRRKDEDGLLRGLSIDVDASDFAEEGFDFTRDWTTVRTACINFGRDRFDILRSLSRQDVQILVGHGCPSTDTKVVFSGKLLRKHVHLDEGDVCSTCSLRSSCNKAYLLARKEDEARTLDVMRILLTFGFDPVKGTVENKSLLKLKSVKTVVRKMLHEVVKLSAVPIDPNLPPPVIKKPPPKVKQPPPPPKKRVGRDDIEMKKGDWLCPKCDFMNFAKNTVCLQCDAKRPKRQLLPGEWECPECNFLNYRRNMACFHCECNRPPDEFTDNQMQARPTGQRRGLERVGRMPETSGAWNFDFDDNESDGADVAAFEFADPPRMSEDSSYGRTQGGNLSEFEDNSFETSKILKAHERGKYSEPEPAQRTAGRGFDDFDDEEDDDVDSYELDTPDNNSILESSSKDFSEVEGYSESEGFDGPSHSNARPGSNSSRYGKPARPMRGRPTFTNTEDIEQDFDSEEEPSVRPSWKSSHVMDSRQINRGKGVNGPYRGNTFGSDDELDLDSDSDDNADHSFKSNSSKRNKRDFRRTGSYGSEDEHPFGPESDDDLHPVKNKMVGNKGGPNRRGSRDYGHFDSAGYTRFRSNTNRRGNANLDSSFQDSYGNDRRSQGGDYGGQRGSRGYGHFDSAGDTRFRSNTNRRGNANLDSSFRDSYGNDRRSQGGDYGGQRGSRGYGHFDSAGDTRFRSNANRRGNANLDSSFRDSYGNDQRSQGGDYGSQRVKGRR